MKPTIIFYFLQNDIT
uniref:Uncharacterized protein n=1 Tax=Rhizophora mucronata TaxID=61149 RepID=A0A2P2NS99_RHIMU